MRALVQRVSRAAVRVEGETIASIGAGLLVLVGVGHDDSERTVAAMAAKIRALRIFADAQGRMNEALGDEREILAVSQFTLYADTARGNRPSFTDAAEPARAQALYELLCLQLDAQRGRFAASMEVELVNDGPVTVLLEVT